MRSMCFPRGAGIALALAALILLSPAVVRAAGTPTPDAVTVAGSMQSEAGCPGDWQPGCSTTRLAFDADDLVWQKTFTLPAGSYEYKAALNNSWDENYGRNARRNGANIPLDLAAGREVRFYYDHETNWIADNATTRIVTAPGNFQSELGCPGDWQPDCLRSWLQDVDGDGVFTFSTNLLPAGVYETKAAVNESWSENYGAGGQAGGANIPFTVPADYTEMYFTFVSATNVLTVSTTPPPSTPRRATIAGNFQSELGCPGDWQPDCATTDLAFDPVDLAYQATFSIPAGAWEYKAALNGTWDESYGRNGGNVGFAVDPGRPVKFYYDDMTHFVADNAGGGGAIIASVPGNFQSEIGCPGDWQPDCLRSWLKDPDGDGVYTFSTRRIPPGNYEAKAAINESWDENYGEGGVRDGANIPFNVTLPGTLMTFAFNATTKVLTIGSEGGPRGNLALARAHWVSVDTIAWNGGDPAGHFALHASADGALALTIDGVTGGEAIPLTVDPAGLPAEIKTRFPHLAAFTAIRVPADTLARVPELLRGQLAVSARTADGKPLDATSIQLPGVVDDLYAHDGPLGITWDGAVPTLRVWAPTARDVKFLLYADADPATEPTVVPMAFDQATGTWSVTGTPGWKHRYYQYEVSVYVRKTNRVEVNRVTDPYSLALSMNSRRSQVVDLNDPALQPPGWRGMKKPVLASLNDISLYELHVRDFSASDSSVRESERGTYLAFTRPQTNGMRHMRSLALAGLTHVHLLPSFDIASVNEDKSTWLQPEGDLASMAPDSDQQQAAVGAVRDRDAFNWGYDPFHFMVPEGSYASSPDGAQRIRDFRAMVLGLSQAGLRVVMDSVFNHTASSGQNENSVLDRIVPEYYHRYNLDGNIERSTCCENTATEHAMMGKLMIDALLVWTKAYQIDGFRFDLMGHHMKRNMLDALAAVRSLTPARDGVDGSKIYFYGEAWNFGEVADGARGENAIQRNMAGTGIGSFNDRLRDGARGGGPFSGLQEQGFLTGLFTDPNGTDQGSPDDQRARLLLQTDWIRVGIAGGLRGFTFVDRNGNTVTGADVDYNGQRAGYTDAPLEIINYISAHDNETLFDAIQFKAPDVAGVDERVRMNNLGVSLVGLSQGIPFFHAGDDLLRSKSLDRNSYNSGDWFNKLDFTYQTNNWGVGLPPAQDNQSNWPVMRPLLADPALKAGPSRIQRAREHFLETLAIRRSSHLFRLQTADEVSEKLRFHNTGTGQIPGLIVYSLSEGRGDAWLMCGQAGRSRSTSVRTHVKPIRNPLPDYDAAVVLLNASPQPVIFTDAAFVGRTLLLHPIQASSSDARVRTSAFDGTSGTFSVPGRTAAVFVCPGGPRGFETKPRAR